MWAAAAETSGGSVCGLQAEEVCAVCRVMAGVDEVGCVDQETGSAILGGEGMITCMCEEAAVEWENGCVLICLKKEKVGK